MEKHKCELCFRNFSNGRALGGHMRSHMMSLPIAPRPEDARSPPPPPLQPPAVAAASHVSDEVESASNSTEEDEGEKSLSYGLRENPKRSIRMVDSEFAFAFDAGCVFLQDRESETESSKNSIRRRSKRVRKQVAMAEEQLRNQNKQIQMNPMKKFRTFMNPSKTESWAAEPEPASSVSDTTTEDVAFCLMMLSRDQWKRQKDQVEQEQHHHGDNDDEQDDEQEVEAAAERSFEESDESEELLKSTKTQVRGKHKCETCDKVFRSYQALGGHRASHKKIKVCTRKSEPELQQVNAGTSAEKKIHGCPICFRIFSSGQALGGHKRTHVIGASESTPVRNSTKVGDNLIDLNLPAPVDDDDDISQIQLSAVSDEAIKKKHFSLSDHLN